MYDIAIIGLGPAGATLARLLDKRYKVIAIDRKNSKTGKCCGGLLSPDAQKILAQFDICLPKDVLVDPQIFSVKTIDLNSRIERFYQRFYINMNRAKFDNFLISLIPNSVEIYSDSFCRKIEKEEGKYRLTFKANGEDRVEEAKIIIGADGANSIVRNTFYKANKIDKYVSVQEWYEDNANSPFYSCIFDKEITDSYCWTISKDNYFIIGGAFPSRDSNWRFELLKKKVKKSGIVFGKLVKREGCFVCFNRGIATTYTGKDGAYLVGEAAGMISPSSLEGISYSMESAKILSGVLNKNLNKIDRKYFIRTLGIRIKLMLKILKMPFMYNTILRRLIMKSGLRTIKKMK
ncbi:MAG: FAD-binding protein [Campylobacteraceae bacterium]|jgi:flavin-dependent dehydrogenase|nr:FAD-binding protein [Campylobacteraceae bacterium]